MAEYHQYFGFGPEIRYELSTTRPEGYDGEPAVQQGDTDYFLVRTSQDYNLYYSMVLFFQNGGGTCYIVSVGDYSSEPDSGTLMAGIDHLVKEQEPTMIVVPDAVLLGERVNCADVQKKAMDQCAKMQSRIAILDVYEGYKARTDGEDVITAFRTALGVNNLDYASAYYPWIDTTVLQAKELDYRLFDDDSKKRLQEILTEELGIGGDTESLSPKAQQQASLLERLGTDNWTDEEKAEIDIHQSLLNKSLIALSPIFNNLLEQIRDRTNRLPPSGAMAGVYTMVDNTRGVWKAPANVSLNGVLKPAVNLSHDEQEDLNVTPQGKSINAIRSFVGEGTLVWGARTLDGNSLDWRYINVRRTMIMLEQSIKLASKAYVFDANDANTWVTMKGMIRNFLTGIWKRGGLAGAVPDDAFSVHVGLGETMTPEDILEGILRVTILVAVSRPAEFIELTFQQQMQKS